MDYPRCKTCKYWDRRDLELYPDMWDPPSGSAPKKPKDLSYEVHCCDHPDQTFWELPSRSDGVALKDGDMWAATLATAEEFGCVRHSALEEKVSD